MAFTDRLANRGSVSTGYDIENSLRFQHTSNEWIYRNSPTSGDRKTFTFSFWLKRASISVPATNYIYDQYFMGQGSNARFHFAGNTIRFMFDGSSTELEATQQLRDTSAWYHIVLAVDTTQATDTNRVKAYLNGNAYEWNNSDWPSQNDESQWMHDQNLYINTAYAGDGSYDQSCYLADFHIIDGQQLTPSSFGETDEDSGIWKPKKFTGSFGDEGAWLKFDSSGSLGADSSGNSNTFTLNNVDSGNQTTDTPSNNFCTLNLNHAYATNNGSPVITEGATAHNGSGDWGGTKATVAVNKGKWYWEMRATSGNYSDIILGVQSDDAPISSGSAHNLISTAGFYSSGGFWIKDSTSGRDAVASGSITHTPGSSILYGIALNMDDGEITYYSNGSVISGLNGVNLDGLAPLYVMPFCAFYNVGVSFNFGGTTTNTISSAAADANGYGTFEHAPPSGYYAICTKNLAEFG